MLRSLCLVAVTVMLAGCEPPKKLDPTQKIEPARSTEARKVSFAADKTYAIRPTTLMMRDSYATYCRLGQASQFVSFPVGAGEWYGNCNHDIVLAKGPAARVRLSNGQYAGVFEIERIKPGEFARVVESFNLSGAIPVTDKMPLHRFRPNAIHILAADANSEESFRRAVLEAFPAIQPRTAGEITEVIVPRCKANRAQKDFGGIVSLSCDVLRGDEIAAERNRIARIKERSAAVNARVREILNEGKAPTKVDLAPPPSNSGTAMGSPALFEGSSYAAFTSAQLQAYCVQDWKTRTQSDGRTEYNPCHRKDAFN
ncbi:MAG: hypothetical protein AAF479_09950 [Pseudomonadota bacterium]